MNQGVRWQSPFSDPFGTGMVYRLFDVGGVPYAVGFEEILTMHDLNSKGIDILSVYPNFRFSSNGVWAVVFDEIEPTIMDFKGFQHVQHTGLLGGKVLLNVASIIYDHYTLCHAGTYVFSAANDLQYLRQTDLADIYNGLLGLGGKPKSRLFGRLQGWEAFSDVATGGRGYVVTTQSY